MSQCDQVLAYIKEFGSISSMEAFKDLGITRLAARILNLEERGYKFEKQIEQSRNRYNKKVSYTRYSLAA